MLEQRDRAQLQLLEVFGQGRGAKPADFITSDKRPAGGGEVTFHLFFRRELRQVDFPPFGHDAEPPRVGQLV